MKNFTAKCLSFILLLALWGPALSATNGTASAAGEAPHLTGVTLVGTSISSPDLKFKVYCDNWQAGYKVYIYAPGYNPNHEDYVSGPDLTDKNFITMQVEMLSATTYVNFGSLIANGIVTNPTNWGAAIVIKDKEGIKSNWTTRDSDGLVIPVLVSTPVVAGTITNNYSKVKSDLTITTDPGALVTLYSDAGATVPLKDAVGTKPVIAAVKADKTGAAKFKFNLPVLAGNIYARATKLSFSDSDITAIPIDAKPTSVAPISYDSTDPSNANTTVGIKNLFSVDSVVYAANVQKDDTLSIYVSATDTANGIKPIVFKKAAAAGALTITLPKLKMPANGAGGVFYATLTTPLKDESAETAVSFSAQAATDITNFVADSSVFAVNTPDSAKVTDTVYVKAFNDTHVSSTDVVKVYATSEDALSGAAAKVLIKGSPKAAASTNGRYLELSKKGLLDAAAITNHTVYVTLTSAGYKESDPVAVSFAPSPQYDASTTAFVFSANSSTATSKDLAFIYKLAAGDTVYVYDKATEDANGHLVVDPSKVGVKLLAKTLVAKGQSEALVSFNHASGAVYYVVKNDATEYSYAKKLN